MMVVLLVQLAYSTACMFGAATAAAGCQHARLLSQLLTRPSPTLAARCKPALSHAKGDFAWLSEKAAAAAAEAAAAAPPAPAGPAAGMMPGFPMALAMGMGGPAAASPQGGSKAPPCVPIISSAPTSLLLPAQPQQHILPCSDPWCTAHHPTAPKLFSTATRPHSSQYTRSCRSARRRSCP